MRSFLPSFNTQHHLSTSSHPHPSLRRYYLFAPSKYVDTAFIPSLVPRTPPLHFPSRFGSMVIKFGSNSIIYPRFWIIFLNISSNYFFIFLYFKLSNFNQVQFLFFFCFLRTGTKHTIRSKKIFEEKSKKIMERINKNHLIWLFFIYFYLFFSVLFFYLILLLIIDHLK